MESGFSPAAHDELLTGVNRAAEQAVPEAKTLLVDAIKNMSVQDAKVCRLVATQLQ
jgi:hypothetical protein